MGNTHYYKIKEGVQMTQEEFNQCKELIERIVEDAIKNDSIDLFIVSDATFPGNVESGESWGYCVWDGK